MDQADWTSIKPYLKPLARLLDDDEVTNIDANPDGAIFYEKRGRKHRAEDIHFTDMQKSIALQNIARQNGQNITEHQPYLTAQLPNGDRITGVSDRISRGGHTLTIRRFPKVAYSSASFSIPAPATIKPSGVSQDSYARMQRQSKRRSARIMDATAISAPTFRAAYVCPDCITRNMRRPSSTSFMALH